MISIVITFNSKNKEEIWRVAALKEFLKDIQIAESEPPKKDPDKKDLYFNRIFDKRKEKRKKERDYLG